MTEILELVARAIHVEFENRPEYAQAQMNGVLASDLAQAAIKAMEDAGYVRLPIDFGFVSAPDQ